MNQYVKSTDTCGWPVMGADVTSGWRLRIGAVAVCAATVPAWATGGAAGQAPAAGAAGPTAAVAAPGPTAASPSAAAAVATSSGGRSMAAAEVNRIERRIEGLPATTIWQARLPDGTLELTDQPPTSSATAVQSRSYALPSDGQARQRADAERAYWRRQAEAFEARRREREREAVTAQAPPVVVFRTDVPRAIVYHGYGWQPPEIVDGIGPSTGVVGVGGPSVYVTSPGAAQGRGSGFIGSGFSTAR